MTLGEFYDMYRPNRDSTVRDWEETIDNMLRPMVFSDMGCYWIAAYFRSKILKDSLIRDGSSQLEELMNYISKSLDNVVKEYEDAVSDFSIIDEEKDFVI